MLRPTIKKRYLLSTIFLGFSSLLSYSQIASAQLRLGRGIQPGLEGHFLEYQIQRQPLEKMRGISGCSVGVGVGCNKTASLLQKIVTEASGKSYQDILLQAAGGRDNYLRFSSYYPQSVNLDRMPLNSFWVDGGDYVLDNYRYSGIGIAQTPQSGLRQIVSQFAYAPRSLSDNRLNLQQGLIGLKTAYGRVLIEEARKISDVELKITASGLSPLEINFHLQQFINSVEALDNGNEQQVKESLYRILSNPYTSDPGVLNRPSLKIANGLEQQVGVGLEGDEYIASVLEGDAKETVVLNSNEVNLSSVLQQGTVSNIAGSSNTPFYVVAGIGGLALVVLLLANLDGDRNSATLAFNSNTTEESETNPSPFDRDTSSIEIVEDTELEPPTNETTSIFETNSVMQFAFLIVLMLFLKKNSYSQ